MKPALLEKIGTGIFILLFCGFLFFIIFDTNHAWVHGEVASLHLERAIVNGKDLKWFDWVRGLDYWSFDGAPRPRFFSYLTQLLSIKFRVWFFQFVPFHPTFNLSWFFSLLSLGLIYRFIFRTTESKFSALLGTSVYLSSIGFLSHFMFWLHPGKPLVAFLTLLALNLALEYKKTKQSRFFLALLISVFVSFFTDETGFFLLILVPFLFLDLFYKNQKFLRKQTAIWITLPLVFVLLLQTVIPYLEKNLFSMRFNFWGYALKGKGFDQKTIWEKLRIFDVFENLWKLLTNHLAMFEWQDFRHLSVIFFLILFSIFSWRPRHRKEVMRWTGVIFLFLVFQTILQARHKVGIHGYYYGSLFSIYFAILFSLILRANRTIGTALGIAATLVLGFFGFSNAKHHSFRSGLKENGKYSVHETSIVSDWSRYWRNRNHRSELIDVYLRDAKGYNDFTVYPEKESHFRPMPGHALNWKLRSVGHSAGLLREVEVDPRITTGGLRLGTHPEFGFGIFESSVDLPSIIVAYDVTTPVWTYQLMSGPMNMEPNRMPLSWRVYGSNDKLNWSKIHHVDRKTPWEEYEIRQYHFPKKENFKFYQFVFLPNERPLRVYSLQMGEALEQLQYTALFPKVVYRSKESMPIVNDINNHDLVDINNDLEMYIRFRKGAPYTFEFDTSESDSNWSGYWIDFGPPESKDTSPTTWAVQISKDGEIWETIQTIRDYDPGQSERIKSFRFPKKDPRKQIRFTFLKSQASHVLELYGIGLL